MAYSAKSQKTYNDKCYRFSIKFVPSEKEEVKRFKEYLKKSGKTANAYNKFPRSKLRGIECRPHYI